MRRFLTFTSLLLVLGTLEACVSESDPPTLFVGMPHDRLKARFGEPLRVEHFPSGAEDWYYSVASWRTPDLEGSVYNDGRSSSGSASITFSDETTTRACPVRLSPDGYVIEPLPAGKIVRR